MTLSQCFIPTIECNFMAAAMALGKDTREGEIPRVFSLTPILDEITIIYNILGSLATLSYYIFYSVYVKLY